MDTVLWVPEVALSHRSHHASEELLNFANRLINIRFRESRIVFVDIRFLANEAIAFGRSPNETQEICLDHESF
jgi:hypothetical protein